MSVGELTGLRQTDGTPTVESACVLCGRQGGAPVWWENGYVALACDCGTTRTSPAPLPGSTHPGLDLHPPSFYALPAGLKLRWFTKGRRAGSLFEVGCGEGDFLAAARHLGLDVSGVDANPRRAERAARHLGVPIAPVLFGESAPLEHQLVDYVFHCDLLSHFPDPISTLEAMASMLRPGGQIWLEVGIIPPKALSWYRLVDGAHLPEHRWFFSRDALERLLATAGLRVVRSRAFCLAPSLILTGLCRRVRGERSAGATTPPAHAMRAHQRQEQLNRTMALAEQDTDRSPPAALRARAHTWARYRLGAIPASVGPGTVLIVAEPVSG